MLFVVATTADGVLYGWTPLASASLWPAVMLHASHNAVFQAVFDKLTADSDSAAIVVGESGVFPVLLYLRRGRRVAGPQRPTPAPRGLASVEALTAAMRELGLER